MSSRQTSTPRHEVAPGVGHPPWYIQGSWITIEYRTDPAHVRRLLPEPLELDAVDPGLVSMVFADYQSCSESGEELLDPVQSQYSEAFLAIKTLFRGKRYTRTAYIWVDRDFSLLRGHHMGFPKKFGSIYQTRPFPLGRAPRVAPGGKFGASLAASDRRLAEARITLREEVETGPTVNGYPLLHTRVVKSIEEGRPDALNELIVNRSVVERRIWAADAELTLFESPTEELAEVSIDEIVGGYYQQVATVFSGGTHELNNLNPEG